MVHQIEDTVGMITVAPYNVRLKDTTIVIRGVGEVVQQSLRKRDTEVAGTHTVRLSPDYQLTAFEQHLLVLEYIAKHPEAYRNLVIGKRPRSPLYSPIAISMWIAARPAMKARNLSAQQVLEYLAHCNRIEAARLQAGLEPTVPYDQPAPIRRKKNLT